MLFWKAYSNSKVQSLKDIHLQRVCLSLSWVESVMCVIVEWKSPDSLVLACWLTRKPVHRVSPVQVKLGRSTSLIQAPHFSTKHSCECQLTEWCYFFLFESRVIVEPQLFHAWLKHSITWRSLQLGLFHWKEKKKRHCKWKPQIAKNFFVCCWSNSIPDEREKIQIKRCITEDLTTYVSSKFKQRTGFNPSKQSSTNFLQLTQDSKFSNLCSRDTEYLEPIMIWQS